MGGLFLFGIRWYNGKKRSAEGMLRIMLYISAEDFLEKTKQLVPLRREEERILAEKMKAGDGEAREKLIAGYLPQAAAHIRHLRREFQTLELVMRCRRALEKAVDSFDFLQDSEPFSHRLSWWLRQTVTAYIAER